MEIKQKMKFRIFEKIIIFCTVIILIGASLGPTMGTTFSKDDVDGSFGFPNDDAVSISVSSYGDKTGLEYNIGNYLMEKTTIEGEEYVRIILGDESNIMKKGSPDVPNVCRSIIVPDDAKMKVEIIDFNYVEFENILIAPSKGIIPRNVDPAKIPYVFGHVYFEDGWYPGNLAGLDEPYIIHDFRGQVVKVNPFQYNPVTRTLRVYDKIKILIYPDGKGEINVLDRKDSLDSVDMDFKDIYENHFLNFGETMERYSPTQEQGNMLVICYDSFHDTMVPFVNWKNMKGIPTEMVNLSDVGSTANDIDLYIDNYYFTNGLTFVLLVGDIQQVPSLTAHGGASDPSYALIVGSDHYADLFIGRFSAQAVDQLETQVERTVEYERFPQAGADWYHNGTGVASNLGTGDDNEYDWEHMRNIRTDLLSYTYDLVDEFYDGNHGGADADGNPTPSMVSDAFNDGRSIANYCGHGWYDSWSTSGFDNDDINNLVNDNMLPYVVCVACYNGAFDWSSGDCFAEAWLKATNNDEPTGAVSVFASSIGQDWDEPMDAQDEIIDILVESYVDNKKTSMGGLSFNGVMHMLDEYGSAAYNEADTWHIFGDPSLQIRTDTPDTMTVYHNDVLISGSSSFDVTVTGLENALCAISYNGDLLGYNYTNINGETTIVFDEPISDIDMADLVVTAYNKMTYNATLDVGAPLRQPAEFELTEGVLIRYPFGINYDIIAEMSEDAEVVTIVADASEQAYVESQYQSHGVDTDNTSYLIAPSDSYWTRDYGPWFAYNYTAGEMEVVDFTYNRPRPNDNDIPVNFANAFGYNHSFMDLEHTGGNYMADGQGIAVSTNLVYSENPSLTPDDVDQLVAEYLGIEQYHVVPDALGEYIQHIDCWAKFLAPDKIMIIEVSTGHSNYYEIEDAVEYWENQTSCYGTPYKIYRVYAHLDEPYINSLILNDKVLVPVTGSSYDTGALDSYESAMPGYEVLGFYGSWANTDAIHCRIKGIPDGNMLYIDHTPITYMLPSDEGFLIEAVIISYNGSLQISSAGVHWKNYTGIWNTIPMSSSGENLYSASIPSHPCGETIYYYISAEDNTGKIANHPFIGESDPHLFNVTLVPDIWIDPSAFHFANCGGIVMADNLTIGNDEFAGAELNFTITYTNDSGLGWLSVNCTNGSLQPDSFMNVSVTVNTTDLLLGEYSESITVTSNDLDESIIVIPVNLTVLLGNDLGSVSVNYPTGVLPGGYYTVNATVENYGTFDQTGVIVNCTIMEGIFGTFLYEDFSGGTFPPEGWSQEESGEWDLNYGNQAGGESPEAYLYWSSVNGDYAFLDSAAVNTIGAPTLTLSFNHSISHYTSTFNCCVYARGINSDSWVDVTPWVNPISDDVPAEMVTVDITGYIGSETQIRFEFDGNDWNLNNWCLDDVRIYSSQGRDAGDIVYTAETTVDIDAFAQKYVEFLPPWDASQLGIYGITITTKLQNDQDTGNDVAFGLVEIFEDILPPDVTNVCDYPDPQCVDGYVNITCSVTDAVEVDSVYVNILGPAGFTPLNVSMVKVGYTGYYHYDNYSVVGVYNYSIWVNDTSGNSAISPWYSFEIVNQSFISVDIDLSNGWNLITIPVENNWMASTIAENITGCLSVSKWDAINQTYHGYIVGGPPAFDFPIVDGYGYFVDVDQPSILSLTGPQVFDVSIPLKIGWNLIGWYHSYNTTASSLAENITGCLSVSKWDAINQTYHGYIVGGPPAFDFDIVQGMGLFVDVTTESTWYGDG